MEISSTLRIKLIKDVCIKENRVESERGENAGLAHRLEFKWGQAIAFCFFSFPFVFNKNSADGKYNNRAARRAGKTAGESASENSSRFVFRLLHGSNMQHATPGAWGNCSVCAALMRHPHHVHFHFHRQIIRVPIL